MSHSNISNLKKISWRLRLKTIESLHHAQSGHVGPCLSIAEILTCLFFNTMSLQKGSKDNDIFILSKGHAVPILYSVYDELGWLEEGELNSLRKIDSRLQGHPDRVALNFLDAGTGALGQGLSMATGYALSNMILENNKNIYCLLGDGEMQEGQIWEGLLYAGVKKIDNLYVILDNNKYQNEKSVSETVGEISFENKIKSFNWEYRSVDGHSISDILKILTDVSKIKGPKFIDAHTIKGKGVDFMENNNDWHSKTLNEENYLKAKEQIERNL
tara:strand:+ start:6340 stop:7155 length:816 start_codon:yes stop_codon:yes gene_type:complete